MLVCVFVFKQKTAYEMRMSDWSSDVCSSDLLPRNGSGLNVTSPEENPMRTAQFLGLALFGLGLSASGATAQTTPPAAQPEAEQSAPAAPGGCTCCAMMKDRQASMPMPMPMPGMQMQQTAPASPAR